MTESLPPIVRLASRLLHEIEQAVKGFPRYHRYGVGARLRDQAFDVAVYANRSWVERKTSSRWTQELVWAIDALRITLQLAKAIRAFRSFAQFEMLASLAVDLGRQAGGWHRQQSRNGQNPSTRCRCSERAQTLSAHAASCEAKS